MQRAGAHAWHNALYHMILRALPEVTLTPNPKQLNENKGKWDEYYKPSLSLCV